MLEFSFQDVCIKIYTSAASTNFEVPLQELLCIEIFAGCAQLSSSLRETGFAVIPIDHMKGKVMKAKLMLLDLTKQTDLDVMVNMLMTANIAYCHCAPVCGTGSRTREIPLPPGMEHLKAEPLRSSDHPLGLPHLQGSDYQRVLAANKLYFVTLCVCFIASLRGFLVSVENPSNAYFWLAMQCLADLFQNWVMRGLHVNLHIFKLVRMEQSVTNGLVGLGLRVHSQHSRQNAHTTIPRICGGLIRIDLENQFSRRKLKQHIRSFFAEELQRL